MHVRHSYLHFDRTLFALFIRCAFRFRWNFNTLSAIKNRLFNIPFLCSFLNLMLLVSLARSRLLRFPFSFWIWVVFDTEYDQDLWSSKPVWKRVGSNCAPSNREAGATVSIFPISFFLVSDRDWLIDLVSLQIDLYQFHLGCIVYVHMDSRLNVL